MQKKKVKKKINALALLKQGVRLSLPSNKRHKSKKDYKRNNKVNKEDYE